MKYVKLGKTDLNVSRVCMGTPWGAYGGIDDDVAIANLHHAFDLGVNFVDTAEGYGAGAAEIVVGKAIAGRRDKLVIASKCGLDWGQFGDQVEKGTAQHINMAGKPSEGRFRNSKPKYIMAALEASLKRLDIDCIDLYQLHYPDSSTPFEVSLETLLKAQEQGKIRYFGVSNFLVDQLRDWMRHGPLYTLQPPYHLFDRNIEKEILPYCLENDIAVINYSTMAHGMLAGRYTVDQKFEGIRASMPIFQSDVYAENIARVDKLKEVAREKDCTTVQLAIAWVLAKGITSALVSAKTTNQVEGIVKGLDMELSSADVQSIEGIFENELPIR